VSTREDREWDAEQDRAWVCRECGRDLDNCPNDHEER
jgi:heterodisulfide reductase subunit C